MSASNASTAEDRRVVVLPYSQARDRMWDGDVMLFRRRRWDLTSLGIARLGRSEFSHAAMAAQWRRRWWCIETHQNHGGGRVVLLSRIVKDNPGRIEVYRSRHLTLARRGPVIEAMLNVAGEPYGWRQFFSMMLKSMPVIRFLWRANMNDRANGSHPVCSAAIARAFRAGGLDLVPNLADGETTPGDLGRSSDLEYLFTIGAA